MKKIILDLIKDEKGQALSEYAVILGVILLAAIAAVTAFKDKIIELFNDVTNAL